jgi:hypothetical protein
VAEGGDEEDDFMKEEVCTGHHLVLILKDDLFIVSVRVLICGKGTWAIAQN